MNNYLFVVDGQERISNGLSDTRFSYNDELVARVYRATDQNLEDAILAVQTGFEVIPKLPAHACSKILLKLLEQMEKRTDELVEVRFPYNDELAARGCQTVVAQTAFNAVIGWDLLERGIWKGAGVLGPEAFDPIPFMEKMADYGFPYGIKEIT